jgi:L-threonylcarbamoyladenylate synthase
MIRSDSNPTRIQAGEIIQRGGVIGFRTDTFYGLGVDPFNSQAIGKIRTLKGREEAKPILVLIADASEVERFVIERSPLFDQVCARHWPGPLTLVAKARAELPEELTSGTGTIGIRLPDDAVVRDLLRICGGALTATSANASGDAPARSAAEIDSYFPGGIDLIIDSGEVTATEPSTVIDVSQTEPRLIRAGAVTMTDLLPWR